MTLLAEQLSIHNPQAYPEARDDAVAQNTAVTKLAKNAVLRFFDLITDSPNNPNYTKTETYRNQFMWLAEHRQSLVEQIAEQLGAISYKHVEYDLYRMDRVPRLERKDDKDLAIMFTAEDVAYEGIKSVTRRPYEYLNDPEYNASEDHEGVANQTIIKALSAIVVRANYLQEIAEFEDASPNAKAFREHIAGTYRQNTLSLLQLAGLLNKKRYTQEITES